MNLPDHIEDRALDLVRELAAAGGSPEAVLEVMRERVRAYGHDEALALASVSLILTFGRCLPGPASIPDIKENRS